MKKPLRQMARSAFARQRGRMLQRFAKPKTSLKPKMNFLETRKNAANYSVMEEKNWRYEDKEDWVKNPIGPLNILSPHFVLCDGSGTPRFTLRYDVDRDGNFWITALQRERTRYKDGWLWRYWSNKEETRASREFQQQLGGIHPSEFLFSEFIFRHRKEIRNGVRMFLDVYPHRYVMPRIYAPLVERFCKKPHPYVHPVTERLVRRLAEINLEKRRVKEILAVP